MLNLLSIVAAFFIINVLAGDDTKSSLEQHNSTSSDFSDKEHNITVFYENNTRVSEDSKTTVFNLSSRNDDTFEDSRSLNVNKLDVQADNNQHNDVQIDCSEFGLCIFIENNLPAGKQYCHCDEACKSYGDCCFDVETFDIPTVKPTKCLPYTDTRNISGHFGIRVVTSCPIEATTEQKRLCQRADVMNNGPWVVGHDNYMYQNRFCAECHGVYQYRLFSLEIHNVSTEDLNPKNSSHHLMQNLYDPHSERINHIISEFIPPSNATVRYCALFEDSDQGDACQDNQFVNPVWVNGTLYRNPHCAPSAPQECLGPLLLSGTEDVYLNPMTVLFQWSQDSSSCYNKIDGLCEKPLQFLKYEMFHTVHLSLSTPDKPTAHVTKRIATIVIYSMLGFILPDRVNVSLLESKASDDYVIRLEVHGYMKWAMTANEVSKLPQNLQRIRWVIRLYSLYAKPTIITTEYQDTAPLYKASEDGAIDFNLDRAIHNESINKMQLIMTDMNIVAPRKEPSYLLNECEVLMIDCGMTNQSLESTMIIQKIKCINIPKPDNNDPSNLAKTILTYSGLIASVVGLLVSIKVHRKAVMHKSVPGSNVENISVSLLITNIMFMVGIGANDFHEVCYAVGIILHYLWLSVFSFKTIALLYITHNLIQMMVKDSHPLLQSTAFFTFVGVSLPLLFLIPAVVMDFFGPLDLHYSGSICFPTGFPANIFFVSIPIGISVVVNLSCLLTVAIFITKQSYDTRNVRKSTSLEFIPVFSRISVVTGFFWISGLIGAVYASETSEYLFIIFCSFQGVFVTIANLSTKTLSRNLRKSSGKTKETK